MWYMQCSVGIKRCPSMWLLPARASVCRCQPLIHHATLTLTHTNQTCRQYTALQKVKRSINVQLYPVDRSPAVRLISEFIQHSPRYSASDTVQISHNTEQQTISITPQSVVDEQLRSDAASNTVRVAAQVGALYTCTVCHTRQYKTMSKQAYQHGVVLIRCNGCANLHLFADHLGWFDNQSLTIADICKQHNISFDTVTDASQLTQQDAEMVQQTDEEQMQTPDNDATHKLPT